VFREEAGRLTASLVRLLGDFDLAEEMVADAVVEAMVRWPIHGMPDRPGAWLLTTARHKAIDRIRRESRYREKLTLIAALPESTTREPDDRLRLIFTCCHPALDPDAQVALTLRAVAGLTTAEIARAFLVPEATLAKRLTRAKQKIVAAGIPYRAPEPEERRERLDQVLRVIYLVFNEAYLTTSGDNASRWELAHDAGWLATLLIRWLPDEPEPLGLLGLIWLHLARWPARVDDEGGLVLLKDQNRLAWDRGQIDDAVSLIARAAAMGRPGPYQVEAAMQAVHCEASTWEDTDWPQLLQLYSLLASMDRTPVVLLNRAVVVAEVEGPGAALEQVEVLARPLARYHLYHATRADLLRRLGRDVEACVADREALRLTTNPAERAVLLDRIGRGTRAAGRDDAG
jgi:RNA polymerase sigma-70 factor (ECF subfamily)